MYEEHSNAVAAWRLWINSTTVDDRRITRIFNLEKRKHNPEFKPNQYKSWGSQNYEKLPKVIMGDKFYLQQVARMYKQHGLHSKELGPIYDGDHAACWYSAAMRWPWVPIFKDVIRATLSMFALCSLRGPTEATYVKLADGYRTHSNKGTDDFMTGGISTAFAGQRAMNHNTVINGNFTNHSAWLDFLAIELGIHHKHSPTDIKPWLTGPPTRSGLASMSDGTVIPFNRVRHGVWWLDGVRNGRMKGVLSPDEVDVLRYALEGDQDAAVVAASYVTFPYQGRIVGSRGKVSVSTGSTKRLNSNKPPVDAAYLIRYTEGSEYTAVLHAICGGGNPKRANWGVRSPGSKEVWPEENKWRVKSVLDEEIVIPRSMPKLWGFVWDASGMALTRGGGGPTPGDKLPDIEERIEEPLPKRWYERAWAALNKWW